MDKKDDNFLFQKHKLCMKKITIMATQFKFFRVQAKSCLSNIFSVSQKGRRQNTNKKNLSGEHG